MRDDIRSGMTEDQAEKIQDILGMVWRREISADEAMTEIEMMLGWVYEQR